MSHFLLKIAAAFITVLALSACNDDYYYDGGGSGGGGYYPPYDYDASRSELIKNCKGAVRERVRNRIGHGAKIDWGNANTYNSSRREATVNGKGTARNKGRKHKLHYKCLMNRRDAYVRSARIELDNQHGSGGGGGGSWNQKAVSACKERIRYQAKRNIRQQFSLQFTDKRVTTPAERRRHVTGKAVVQGKKGNGRIAYDCKLHVNPLRVDSAGYRWIKPLPPTGGGDWSNGGGNHAEAKRLCKANLKNRLHTFGYRKINFLSASVRNLSGNKKRVDLRIKAATDGNSLTQSYTCHVNPKNGKVLKMQQTRN